MFYDIHVGFANISLTLSTLGLRRDSEPSTFSSILTASVQTKSQQARLIWSMIAFTDKDVSSAKAYCIPRCNPLQIKLDRPI